MTADVISFVPTYRRSREADLWDAYLCALANLQSEYPLITIESCRRAVTAWDAFEAECRKAGSGA